MSRLLYALAVGLVGAGIVHIAILFLIPAYSERDAWSRLTEMADLYGVTPLEVPAGEKPLIRSADPFFKAIACRFDLADGIAHVGGTGEVPFWSVSVYDRNGQNVYSFNDHTQEGTTLDFAVMTPAQIVEVRKELPAALERSVFVEANIGEGIVVIRAFAPDDSYAAIVSTFLKSVSCGVV
ncbi:MAG TPA: DUF1254 domain-containing protein [Rhizobiaceae bacterium]|nr:DUF1254 domain-containing protein [Rhizobiaceae bacterium]